MRISVLNSRELLATVNVLKKADKEVAREIRQQTKEMIGPAWNRAVAENVTRRVEARVLADTTRVAVSNQNVTLKAASVGRNLPGGLSIKQQWQVIEFGGRSNKPRTYDARSRTGRNYSVTRNTTQQLRPSNRKGYVVYPAAARVIPRLASLWVQTTMRTYLDSFEGR